MQRCPVCGQRAIGRVGVDQYYCWDCCVEFTIVGEEVRVFDVGDDGTLTLHVETEALVN